MARRNQRKGSWLATDDLTGFTVHADKLRLGYYGEMSVKPFERNWQEVAMPLNDPRPVSFFRAPNYENTSGCPGATAPKYVGVTSVLTRLTGPAVPALNLDPAIPDMAIGCSFVVR